MITVNIVENDGETYKELLRKELECERLHQEVAKLNEELLRLKRLCAMKDKLLQGASLKEGE